MTAVTVLVLGIVCASLIYGLGKPAAGVSDDPALIGDDKAESRQVEMIYGKQGVLVNEWLDDLKEPGVQAVIVIVTTALVAGGCFYLAGLLDRKAGRG